MEQLSREKYQTQSISSYGVRCQEGEMLKLEPETLVVERSVPLLASKTFEPKGGGLL